jgi:hypothetical protein
MVGGGGRKCCPTVGHQQSDFSVCLQSASAGPYPAGPYPPYLLLAACWLLLLRLADLGGHSMQQQAAGGARAQLLQSFACKPFFQFTGEPTVYKAMCAGRLY